MVYLIIACLVYHNSTCFRQKSVYYFHIKTETTRKSSSFGLLNQKLIQAFYPSDIFLLYIVTAATIPQLTNNRNHTAVSEASPVLTVFAPVLFEPALSFVEVLILIFVSVFTSSSFSNAGSRKAELSLYSAVSSMNPSLVILLDPEFGTNVK